MRRVVMAAAILLATPGIKYDTTGVTWVNNATASMQEPASPLSRLEISLVAADQIAREILLRAETRRLEFSEREGRGTSHLGTGFVIYEGVDEAEPLRQGDIFKGIPRADFSLEEFLVVGPGTIISKRKWSDIVRA